MSTPDVRWAVRAVLARGEVYRQFRDYYEGRHRILFTSRMDSAFKALFQEFADNLCATVVDSVAERLEIEAFVGPDADRAWEIWQANEMELRAAEIDTVSLSEGDGYVLVWPDEDEPALPRMWPQQPDQVAFRMDRRRPLVTEVATKAWSEEGSGDSQGGRTYKLNLYYRDRIERYVTKSKAQGMPDDPDAWEPRRDDEDGHGEALENPWEVVPLLHLPNGLRLGRPGRSELVDVIPLQDALNKSTADMLVGMEHVALPQRWATGVEDRTIEYDEETGVPVPGEKPQFQPGVDKVWTSRNIQAAFGQFPPADLTQLLSVQESFARRIARVSGTPVHQLLPPTGEWPSGESLKTAETRLVKKVLARQRMRRGFWLRAMHLALRMARVSSDPKLTDVTWESAETRNELAEVQVAEVKVSSLGIPKRQVQLELGYKPEEVERFRRERETEATEMGGAMLAAFDRQPGATVVSPTIAAGTAGT